MFVYAPVNFYVDLLALKVIIIRHRPLLTRWVWCSTFRHYVISWAAYVEAQWQYFHLWQPCFE